MKENKKLIYVYKDTWERLDVLCKRFPDIKKLYFVDKAVRAAISTELIKRDMEEDYGRSTESPTSSS